MWLSLHLVIYFITVTVAFTFEAIYMYYILYCNSPVNESLDDLLAFVSSHGAGLERIFNL